jgi:hypothetical protein
MTSVTVPQTGSGSDSAARRLQLRRLLIGGAAFDGAMGVVCLAAASDVGDWLSIPTAGMFVTAGIFFVAAIAGFAAVRRPRLEVRWVVAANVVFAVWCLVMLAIDHPSSVGGVLLAGAAATSAGTAVVEQRLSARADR